VGADGALGADTRGQRGREQETDQSPTLDCSTYKELIGGQS